MRTIDRVVLLGRLKGAGLLVFSENWQFLLLLLFFVAFCARATLVNLIALYH